MSDDNSDEPFKKVKKPINDKYVKSNLDNVDYFVTNRDFESAIIVLRWLHAFIDVKYIMKIGRRKKKKY